ncbi:MAG: hypothetical protein HC886_14945 [Leptolyngbyaceae cyanobacterium SM1_1_3]|nr:hypothetical protein [Leptolyngbyaceae cyanobacterium SM1_1_3]NJN04699.1 hypothetical protein [Leptolyngbyaceae cyanobacterium RM1_1_2]NJO11456.1 hypothetical protein [Leptolyngbyaceae cyanobacterium SL_1_1]
MPKFLTQRDWQQAQVLMQPVLIRVIDNIRKQLETSTWQGTYKTEYVWPETATSEHKQQVTKLQEQLQQAKTPAEIDQIEQQLAQLPTSTPLYELQLKAGDHLRTIDIWQLCYQVCFQNYDFQRAEEYSVTVDSQLLDEATGSVDWDKLDEKASQIVGNLFE